MALTERVEGSNVLYLYIVQGHLMQRVKEDFPEAVKREYVIDKGRPTEKNGHKWEIQHKNLTGFIDSVTFKESPYGEQFQIKITDGAEAAILQFPTSSKYFSSFAQRFFNLDFSKQVTLNAYDFENDKGKQIAGMSVIQDGKKIGSHFWDDVSKAPINGLPLPDDRGEGFDSDDWKYHFSKVKKFLKSHVLEVIASVDTMGHASFTPKQEEDLPTNPLTEHSKLPDPPEDSGADDDLPF